MRNIIFKCINASLLKSTFLPRYSQLSCQQMDLYLELIANNKRNIDLAEKKEKYQDAINYCINIIKVKQKLYGIDNKSQNEEKIKIADLYVKLQEKEKALLTLDDVLAHSNKEAHKLEEIYSRKAEILKSMNRKDEVK